MFEVKVDVLLFKWNKFSESTLPDDFCSIYYIVSRKQFFFPRSELLSKHNTVLICTFEVRQ